MINGYSIRKCTEIVEIIVPTSFYWRHKFLDAIRVSGVTQNITGIGKTSKIFSIFDKYGTKTGNTINGVIKLAGGLM